MRVRGRLNVSALSVVIAAAVIGCGGGGTASRSGIGESNGSTGADTTTQGGMTTGEITTGTTATTVVNDPTTGGASHADPVPVPGGTVGTSTGGSTTGEIGIGGVPSGPSSGVATTGGSTAVNPTSSGGTGGGISTIGSGTTGSSTTGDLPPPVLGPAPVGLLRSNAIYFGHWNDLGLISSVLADGTGRVDVGGLNPDVVGAIPDPKTTNGYIYGLLQNGGCVLYRGTTFDPSRSMRLIDDSFDGLTSLQATNEGDLVFVAVKNGESAVYILRDGSLQRIDSASSCGVSRDGETVAYTKIVDDLDTLYVWTRSSNTTRSIAPGGDSLYPSFSKDGAWILFSSSRDGSGDTPFDLYQVPSGGGAIERITSTPFISEFGACYNEARTMISYAGFSINGGEGGVYVSSNLGVRRIAADNDVRFATYWTDSVGRSSRSVVGGARFQRIRSRRKP